MPGTFVGPRLAMLISGRAIIYGLLDQFTTALAAGSVNGTAAEPGPGTRTVVDTTPRLSITGGKASSAAGAAIASNSYGNVARVAGRALVATVKDDGNGIRFEYTTFPNQDNFLKYISTIITIRSAGLSNPTVYSVSGGLDLPVMMILRGAGQFYLIKPAARWLLLYVTTDDTAIRALGFTIQANTVGTVDNIGYTNLGDAFATQYGLATNRIASPADGEVTRSTPDAIIEFTLVAQAGVTQSIYFRRTDDNNTFRLDCDQLLGTIKLYKREASVDTELDAGKTQTWVATNSYHVEIQLIGSGIRTFVDENAKHIVTNAYNATVTGIKVSNLGSNLICWPVDLPLPSGI